MIANLIPFGLRDFVVVACLAVLTMCILPTATANASTAARAVKITVHHYVDIGLNFPYYVLARTDLRIGPFAKYDNAYAQIHRKYGKIDVDWNSVPRVGDVWWDWLWPVSANGPYESAEQAITHFPSRGEDAELNAAAEKLGYVAKSLIPDYVKHWKQIQAEVSAVVQAMLESFPTEEILRRNEEILRRAYEPADAFFYYDLLRTRATQSWEHDGDSIYIVGLDYLRDAKGFAGFMAHELRHILINQSGIFGREDIRTLIKRIHPLTKDWTGSSEVGCVIENMNWVLDAWYEHGIDFEFHQVQSYKRREEDRIIARAFCDNRQILANNSFEEFVEASLKQLAAFEKEERR